jgi:hypothetical protein
VLSHLQILLTETPKPRASPVVLTVLLVIFAASVWVFAMLVRRETLRRRWVAMGEWGKSRGLRPVNLSDDRANVSAICKALEPYNPKLRALLEGKQISIAQVATDPTETAAAIKPQWHILARRLEHRWPPTGLRPTEHTNSLLDLFTLSSFPSLLLSAKFVLFGSESDAARLLAQSGAGAILPADVGLLVHGDLLMLDFTSRHFDEVEFGRLIELAEQLAARLDAVAIR